MKNRKEIILCLLVLLTLVALGTAASTLSLIGKRYQSDIDGAAASARNLFAQTNALKSPDDLRVSFDQVETLARQAQTASPIIQKVFVVKQVVIDSRREPVLVYPCDYAAQHPNWKEQMGRLHPEVVEVGGEKIGVLYLALDTSALRFIQISVSTTVGLMLAVFVFLLLYLFTRQSTPSTPVRVAPAPGELVRLERLALVGWLAPNILHDLQKPITNIKHEIEDLSQALGNFAGATRSLRNMRDQVALYFDTMAEADIERFVRSDRADMEYVDINRAIEQALKLVHFERGATVVRLELTQGLPLVLAHPYQLVQVFATVLLHCYDALKGRGEVRIATRPENTKQGMLAVAVISDNGSGYAPEELERLFNPSITQDIGKNVGVDLSISRTIAQEQGGNLTVTSALNEGTRYTVQLRAGD